MAEHSAEDVEAARTYLTEQKVAVEGLDDDKIVETAMSRLDTPAAEPEPQRSAASEPAPTAESPPKPERHAFRDALEAGDIDGAVAAYDSLAKKIDGLAPSIQQMSRISEATLIQMGLARIKPDFPQAAKGENVGKLVQKAAVLLKTGGYMDDPFRAFEDAAVLVFGGARKPTAESDAAKRLRKIKAQGSTDDAEGGEPPEKKLSHKEISDKIGLLVTRGKIREAEDLSRKYGIMAE
jgi:hypothetical protein